MEDEANEWWQWLKHAYKEDDKDDEEKFLHWNIKDKFPVIVGGGGGGGGGVVGY